MSNFLEPEYALSILAGLAENPKDFDYIDKNIPCQAACPAETDIPGYLEEIYKGNYEEAYRINLRDNVFPAILGRVCTRPCEPACRHGWEGLGEPVAICFAKRSADDFMQREKPILLDKVFDSSGRKVAIVGSGPSGLTIARQLTLWGHDVTVYDKNTYAGGNMMDAIPDFRLPREVVKKEVDQVLATGFELKLNTEIGKDILLEDLRSENDAVVLCAGTLEPRIPHIPGTDLEGVQHGVTFLNFINLHEDGHPDFTEKKVIVIGGGFTAFDCARMAKRLGADDARLVYRRTKDEIVMTQSELDEFENEGIHYEFLATPVSFNGKEMLSSVTFARTKIEGDDVSIVSDSVFDLDADYVFLGTGQFKTEGLPKKSEEGLFIGGDYCNGAESVIDAIGHGKKRAEEIDEFLMGKKRFKKAVMVEDVPKAVTGRSKEMDQWPLNEMPTLTLEKRDVRAEVEKGYGIETAINEAGRCYLCNFKFEIDNDLCIYCDRCLKVMPVDNCIVRISSFVYDEKDRITGFIESNGGRDYNHLYLDQNECTRCGACVEVCPVDCITLQKTTKVTVPIS